MLRRVVLVVCLGVYAASALIGFDDYGKVCLSADRVLWHGEGERLLPLTAADCLSLTYSAAHPLAHHWLASVHEPRQLPAKDWPTA